MSYNLNISPPSQIFLSNLARLQNATNQAQEQLSSGFKVQAPSDAPDQISELLQLEANLQSNTQVTTNLSTVKAQVDSGESALSNAVLLTQQAVSLGAQGASSTQTASARQTLGQQVQDILSQLVGISNTTVAGKYIFSGDSSNSSSYQVDSTSTTGVDRLITTQASQQIQDTNGATFPISETAQTIFDHRNPDDSLAPDNLFAAVSGLQTALANNDTAGISTALASLHTAADYLNSQQAFYGTVQDRVASATTTGQSQSVSLQAQIALIRDADPTQAAIELTAGQTDLSAAYGAEAKLPKTSLFDYLG